MLLALDSHVFIAALSPHEECSVIAKQLVRDIASGKHRGVGSSIVYGEVLSTSTGALEPTDFEAFVSHITNLTTAPADNSIYLRAGDLRKQHGPRLKLPDAIHLATAEQARADWFITNDEVLARAESVLPTKLLAAW